MRTRWFTVGALFLAVAVAAGALGAHGLRARIDAPSLALWETAVRYLALAGVGLIGAGLATNLAPGRAWTLAGASLTAGALVFSGTVGALALGGPRLLGAFAPVGGVLLILGFVAMALAALRR